MSVEQKAKEHALSQYPKESVGIITKTDEYIPLVNIHESPTTDFHVDPTEYEHLVINDNIKSVIHSHTKKQGHTCLFPYPTKLDMETQMAFNVPFGITYTDGERASNILYFGDTVKRAPLVGRPFIHGVQDCYSLIRDYYYDRYKIWIREFPRDWNWWQHGQGLYKEGFEKAGFKEIQQHELKEGDVLLMTTTAQTVRENNPNHAGIYLGRHKLLHHRCNGIAYDKSCVSSTRFLDTQWIRFVSHYLRYVGE